MMTFKQAIVGVLAISFLAASAPAFADGVSDRASEVLEQHRKDLSVELSWIMAHENIDRMIAQVSAGDCSKIRGFEQSCANADKKSELLEMLQSARAYKMMSGDQERLQSIIIEINVRLANLQRGIRDGVFCSGTRLQAVNVGDVCVVISESPAQSDRAAAAPRPELAQAQPSQPSTARGAGN